MDVANLLPSLLFFSEWFHKIISNVFSALSIIFANRCMHISVLLYYFHVLFQSFLPQQKEQVFLIDKWLLSFVIMQGTSKVAYTLTGT